MMPPVGFKALPGLVQPLGDPKHLVTACFLFPSWDLGSAKCQVSAPTHILSPMVIYYTRFALGETLRMLAPRLQQREPTRLSRLLLSFLEHNNAG